MPLATLLLRETSTQSLTSLVAKSLDSQQTANNGGLLSIYELRLNTVQQQLELLLTNRPALLAVTAAAASRQQQLQQHTKKTRFETATTATVHDEGFESDMDSLSLVSNESETKTTCVGSLETDSANGSSSSSDSDTEPQVAAATAASGGSTPNDDAAGQLQQVYRLVECCCYTEAKCPDLLVFVIRQETFVFRFHQMNALRHFYQNFTAAKALSFNQQSNISNNTTSFTNTFNLVQRTDYNGVTHIEIRSLLTAPLALPRVDQQQHPIKALPAGGILSLNTPDEDEVRRVRTASTSHENLLGGHHMSSQLKVWNSTDDLLRGADDGAPTIVRPPERRKKQARAPIFSGQYVRVMVAKGAADVHPRKCGLAAVSAAPSVVKSRSRSESRVPMAFRCRDSVCMTATNPATSTTASPPTCYATTAATINRRLFGLSPKLRDFTYSSSAATPATTTCHHTVSTVGEFGGGGGVGAALTVTDGGHLKSVIKSTGSGTGGTTAAALRNTSSSTINKNISNHNPKKTNNNNNNSREPLKWGSSKKKPEKKVTFSAYTTVQVV